MNVPTKIMTHEEFVTTIIDQLVDKDVVEDILNDILEGEVLQDGVAGEPAPDVDLDKVIETVLDVLGTSNYPA